MATPFNPEKLGLIVETVKAERQRQVVKWGNKNRSVPEYVMLMEDKLREVRTAWCTNEGDQAALMEVLKLAALALACIEQNAPESSMIFTRYKT